MFSFCREVSLKYVLLRACAWIFIGTLLKDVYMLACTVVDICQRTLLLIFTSQINVLKVGYGGVLQ